MTRPSTRAQRRAEILTEHRATRRQAAVAALGEQRRGRRLRIFGFGLVVVAILGGGLYLALGDLFGQRGASTTAQAIPVRLSMAGFTPAEIHVPAGQTVLIDMWTTDAAPHLENGVHTMISEALGIHEELPAAGSTGESRRMIAVQMPMTPGTYDIYCDSCCGGRDSPTMHGKIVVDA